MVEIEMHAMYMVMLALNKVDISIYHPHSIH